MAGRIPNDQRDIALTAFREFAIQKWTGENSEPGVGWVPLVHQRKWWAETDGLLLLEGVKVDRNDPGAASVRLADGSVEWWATQPRPGGRAKVMADLGAFKVGKSIGAGFWAAGFAAIPGAVVNIVGLEYDTCAPEFNYIEQMLLSDRGLGLYNEVVSRVNRPRDGRMYIEFRNGVKYEAKSWERKEALKGKEIDAYIYAEAYQLPGLECYTDFSQNLRARKGYAIFPTTPDRPWVQELHNRAHSGDPTWKDWGCVCGIDAANNPLTYDAAQRERDRELMTREKYAIHYGGQLGDFVGRVFQYQRGQRLFSPETHPALFKEGSGSLRDRFRLPAGWEVVTGADTGTYYTALVVAFSPEGDAFVLDEFPNYAYVSGRPEREESVTIPGWSKRVVAGTGSYGARAVAWADANSQFKQELLAYGVTLLPEETPVETRTEITREYFQHGKIWLAPWLQILPFELENARWPEEATSAGKFARVKDRDHTLDSLEHILARRPRGDYHRKPEGDGTWGTAVFGKRKSARVINPHLGNL